MNTIKGLERVIFKKQKELTKLRDELDDLKDKNLLPGLKKKYEGRYFKYRNSYSGDETWFIYTYVYEVTGTDKAICDSFECDIYGEWYFKIGKESGLYLFQTEITQKEYDKEALKIHSAIATFIQLKD